MAGGPFNPYEANLDCYWLVESKEPDTDMTVMLFTNVESEGYDLANDWVTIYSIQNFEPNPFPLAFRSSLA